jgi:YD repeat-containing protein
MGRVTQYTGYDNLGRLTQFQRMLGGSPSDVSKIERDGFGRVKLTTSLAGVSGKEMVTSREYDQLDRVTKVTDALLGQTNYVYDNRGFLVQSDDELGHSTYFYSDDVGRLAATWTEGFSQTTGTLYTHDAIDRVKTMTDPLNNVTT